MVYAKPIVILACIFRQCFGTGQLTARSLDFTGWRILIFNLSVSAQGYEFD